MRIDGFFDLTRIGSGGFSVVYSAREEYSERLVAIKVLHALDRKDAAGRDRFLREVKTMGQLSEVPNIVAFLRPTFADGGEPCIVMPFLSGGNLAQRLERSGPLAAKEVVDIGAAIALALSKAHQRHIHHRDIKPENLLLDEDGTAHLADFGIAGMAGRTMGAATAAALSPPHAPPERLGPPSEVYDDAAGDVYSLGSTLYTLLTGEAPHGDPATLGTQQFADRVLRAPAPPIGRRDVPEELEATITDCLAKDPDGRPTARQLADALRAVRIGAANVAPVTHTLVRHRPDSSPRDSAPVSDDAVAETATPEAPATVDSAAGATIIRHNLTQPDGVEHPADTAKAGRWRWLVVAGVALVVLVASALVTSRLANRQDGQAASTTEAAETAPSSSAARSYEPASLEDPVLLSDGAGFSIRWSDPNSPAAPLRYYLVEVDGRVSLPSESDDLTEREFIIDEVAVADASEPVDVSTSEYCVTVFVGDDPASVVPSDTKCIGPVG